MSLRFSTAVRTFALGLVFTESAYSIVDETRIVACTINIKERKDIDLDFEGFNSLGDVFVEQADGDEFGLNCMNTVMNDEKRPGD